MINEVLTLCGISGLLWFIINETDIVTSETKGAGFLWALWELNQWLILAHYDVCSTPGIHIACVVIWILLLISWVQVVLMSSGSLPSASLCITAPMEMFLMWTTICKVTLQLLQTPAKVLCHINLHIVVWVIIKCIGDYQYTSWDWTSCIHFFH